MEPSTLIFIFTMWIHPTSIIMLQEGKYLDISDVQCGIQIREVGSRLINKPCAEVAAIINAALIKNKGE